MNYSKGIYSDKAWLTEHYVNQRLSLRKVASICQCDPKAVDYWLRKFQIPKRPVGSKGDTGDKCVNWKGGKRKSSGYVVLFLNRKCYIGQHRIVAATVLKRGLRKGEVVHHINIDPSDNRPENLYVFPSQAEHKAYHQALKSGRAIPLKSNL
jgi:hypothetical protein